VPSPSGETYAEASELSTHYELKVSERFRRYMSIVFSMNAMPGTLAAKRLSGKVALITGIGGGQGREAAVRFSGEGATVIGCDINGATAKETLSTVREAGLEADIESRDVDLGDPEQARAWVEGAAQRHGRIDIVYNNGSAARMGSIAELSVEDWQFTIRNELDLVFYVTKYAWPILVRSGGGVVINTASVAGWAGNRSVPFVAHMAAKGGVIAMTRQLAAEGGSVGIRAVSISPGVVVTPGTADLLAVPEARDALVAQNLIPRLGQPADVVSLALFLASDEAGYITGSDFVVDGGFTAA
jgi:meso-butanediol dehydrogenase/(S,S)-butanediol dehydrogenase/diacetyl reductase